MSVPDLEVYPLVVYKLICELLRNIMQNYQFMDF